MMTSVTGTLKTTKGFTLVEIMVTLVIIALMAMAVTFVVPDRDDDTLVKTTDEFVQRVRYAQEYALLQHAILGLEIDEQGYQFLQWQEQQWVPLDYRGLRAQEWPYGILWELESETEGLLGQDEDAIEAFFTPREEAEGDDENVPEPQLWILGSGDISVFTLQLRSSNGGPQDVRVIESRDGYSVTLQEEQSQR